MLSPNLKVKRNLQKMFLKDISLGFAIISCLFYCSEWFSLYCQNQISLTRPSGKNRSAEIKEPASFNLSETVWY